MLVFPLVLNISSSEMYALEGVAVVAKDLVAELVVGVFRTPLRSAFMMPHG